VTLLVPRTGHGAPDAAAAYLRRAQAEPPGEPDRATVALELGTAEMLAGESTAQGTLAVALDTAAAPAVRGGRR
jgi:hypothetical protein